MEQIGFREVETGCAAAKLSTRRPPRWTARLACGHLMLVTWPSSLAYSKRLWSGECSACQSHISEMVREPSRGGGQKVEEDSAWVLGAGGIGTTLRELQSTVVVFIRQRSVDVRAVSRLTR